MTLDERVDLEDALLDIERALNDIVREVEAAQATLTALTGFARLLASGPGTQCDNPECPWWKGPSAAALRRDHSYVRPNKGPH